MDIVARYIAYLFSQYNGATNLTDYISSFLTQSQDVYDQTVKLYNTFNRELSTNDQLDLLGLLYGVPRFYIPDDDNYFQFDVTPLDSGFGFAPNSDIGYRQLTDAEYKAVLSCWAITLNSVGNTNQLIQALTNLFQLSTVDSVVVTEDLYNVNYTITEDLTVAQIAMYEYVTPCGSRLFPKIGGIQYNITYTLEP